MQELLRAIDGKSMKKRLPACRVGDTVRVMIRVRETTEKEERTRLQAFEGVDKGAIEQS